RGAYLASKIPQLQATKARPPAQETAPSRDSREKSTGPRTCRKTHAQLLLKIRYFLALFRKKPKRLVPPARVYIKRRRHLFSLTLPLQTLQLVHRAVELPVQMRFVAEKFVRCVL